MDNIKISAIISYEIVEFFLMCNEYGSFDFGLNLNKVQFTDFKIESETGFDINSADIETINLISNHFLDTFKHNLKPRNIIIKTNILGFHRPCENTFESF